ncbi:MAG: NAAT family transporter [Anaerolineaceae bacterium]|nr:NAAT family transporter [Anaerolineaceae bacterium]
MNDPLNFGLLAFASLFTMINPLGVVPVYVSMTASLTKEQARRTALKATVTALAILVVFTLTGQLIFQFFSISVNSLRVVGGVIFFIMGYDMLQARLSRTKHDDEPSQTYVEDIAVTPLAIPMICGPGAITSVIVFAGDAVTVAHQAVLFVVMAGVMVMTYAALRGSQRIMDVIGENGNRVLMRLMGLIVMAIAVEFFFGGLKPILRDIFMIGG